MWLVTEAGLYSAVEWVVLVYPALTSSVLHERTRSSFEGVGGDVTSFILLAANKQPSADDDLRSR